MSPTGCSVTDGAIASGSEPVDLDHLARQTFENVELQAEILELFMRQSALYMERARCATTSRERAEAIHTIKGSARGIGAWRVAERAADVEAAQRKKKSASAMQDLASAVEEANQYIATLASNS